MSEVVPFALVDLALSVNRFSGHRSTLSNNNKFWQAIFCILFCVAICQCRCPTASSSPMKKAADRSQTDRLNEIIKLVNGQEISSSTLAKLANFLEANPHNFQALLLLGICYDKLSLPDQAKEQFQTAARYLPNDPIAVVKVIQAQVSNGQLQSAAILAQAAARRFPNNAQINFCLGDLFSGEDQISQAESAYLRAIESHQKVIGLPTALARLRLKQRRFTEAYLLADLDIKRAPDFWLAYQSKGEAAIGLANFEKR